MAAEGAVTKPMSHGLMSLSKRGEYHTNTLPAHCQRPLTVEENERRRAKYLAPSLKAHYGGTDAGPLKPRHGRGPHLYDEELDEYLDCVNNVCHVGHCHPRVVLAATAQLGLLNTNSRYVHDNIVRLAEALIESLPAPLSKVFFVNSGSEANDLALRLARRCTGKPTVYCVAEGYHGTTSSCMEVSAYSKYAPNFANTDRAIKLMQPSTYSLQLSEEETTRKAVSEYESHLTAKSPARPPAAFIVESIMCCGGVTLLPDGYLKQMSELTRSHGGLVILDEVQVGFGRTGSNYWAFQAHGVVPDIMTVGKPFGNGFPLAAVVVTEDVLKASSDIEYFNTFGGNPVACAVGLEVMNVIHDECLQANALTVGKYTLDLLGKLKAEFPTSVGDVRGIGLMLGIELVVDGRADMPDAEGAAVVMQRMKSLGVLVSSDGFGRNVLKMKPAVVFSKKDADRLYSAMHTALSELVASKEDARESKKRKQGMHRAYSNIMM